jgi:hypothetical protein
VPDTEFLGPLLDATSQGPLTHEKEPDSGITPGKSFCNAQEEPVVLDGMKAANVADDDGVEREPEAASNLFGRDRSRKGGQIDSVVDHAKTGISLPALTQQG